MSDLQKFAPTPEALDAFRFAYIRVMGNAAVISGVQPAMTMGGSTAARREILADLEALKTAYESVQTNAWAQSAYNEIEKRLKPVVDYNAETVGDALKDYCEAFFTYVIQNFSPPKAAGNKNPFV
jgi:hypothetical protein